MALIICPACGRRMLDSQGLRFCTNCGSPLQARREKQHEPETNQALLPITASEQTEERQALVLCSDGTVMRLPEENNYKAVEAYNETTGLPRTYEDLSGWPGPYANKFNTIVTEEPNPAATWETTQHNVPWWFPRRSPDIAGTLIHVQEQQVSSISIDIMDVIFRFFSDMLWGMAGEYQAHQSRSERDHAVVTTLRIRSSDGRQSDARLRGYLTGANLTLGDKVSLWGRRRRGMLVVRRGFNHTSRSVISASATKSPLLALVLLALAVGIFLWLFWGHIPLLIH